MFNILIITTRRSILARAWIFIAGFGCVILASGLNPVYASHTDNINVLLNTVALIMPIFAGFTAWDTAKLRHASANTDISAGSVRSKTQLLMIDACRAFLYAALILAALLVFILARQLILFHRIPSGELPFALSLAVVMAVVMFTAVAVAVGSVLRGWRAVVWGAVPPLAVYGITFFASESGLLGSFLPYGNRGGNFFYTQVDGFFYIQSLTYGAVAALVLVLATCVEMRKIVYKGAASLLSLSLIVCGWMLVDNQGTVWAAPKQNVTKDLQRFATADGSLVIRANPDIAPVSDEVLRVWSRVQAIVAGTPLEFHELAQTSESVTPSNKLQTFYEGSAGSDYAYQTVVASMQPILLSGCKTETTVDSSLVVEWLAGVPAADLDRSALTDEYFAGYLRLSELDITAANAWFRDHYQEFMSCKINLAY